MTEKTEPELRKYTVAINYVFLCSVDVAAVSQTEARVKAIDHLQEQMAKMDSVKDHETILATSLSVDIGAYEPPVPGTMGGDDGDGN